MRIAHMLIYNNKARRASGFRGWSRTMKARTNLNISYNQKDAAKKCARDHGTRIMWDRLNKVWYWEGVEGSLPECLKKYLHENAATDQVDFRAKEEADRQARDQREHEAEAERCRAYALEKEGRFDEALEIVKTCVYNWGYDGEGEIYRLQDISRLEEKIAGVHEQRNAERAEEARIEEEKRTQARAETAENLRQQEKQRQADAVEDARSNKAALEAAVENMTEITSRAKSARESVLHEESEAQSRALTAGFDEYEAHDIDLNEVIDKIFEMIEFDNIDFATDSSHVNWPAHVKILHKMHADMKKRKNEALKAFYKPFYDRFTKKIEEEL